VIEHVTSLDSSPAMRTGDHPGYFARVPGPSSFAGVLGDWLGTGFNSIATSWSGASGPTTVELVVIEWLLELIGLPSWGEGVLVRGGSIANLTALAATRHSRGAGVAYLRIRHPLHRGSPASPNPSSPTTRWSSRLAAASTAAPAPFRASPTSPAFSILALKVTDSSIVSVSPDVDREGSRDRIGRPTRAEPASAWAPMRL